jgi:hypothetical protein
VRSPLRPFSPLSLSLLNFSAILPPVFAHRPSSLPRPLSDSLQRDLVCYPIMTAHASAGRAAVLVAVPSF